MTRPAATALALLAAVAAAAFAPAARAVTACPHDPNAQGLSAVYVARNPTSSLTGGLQGTHLNMPLLSTAPVVVDPSQAVNWTRVEAVPTGPINNKDAACTCGSYPTSCNGPFTFIGGVCNIPPSRPLSGNGIFNPYLYWGVVMTGSISVTQTGYYTFAVSADDGMTMWVDGQLVAHQSSAQSPFGSTMAWPPGCTSSSGTRSILLVSRQKYAVLIRHYQNAGSSGLSLYWSASSTQGGAANLIAANTKIPDSAFSPCAPTGTIYAIGQTDVTNTCAVVRENQLRVDSFGASDEYQGSRYITSGAINEVVTITPGQKLNYEGYLKTSTAVGTSGALPNNVLLSNMYRLYVAVSGGSFVLYLDDVQILTGTSGASVATATSSPVPLVHTTSTSGYKLRLVYTKTIAANGSIRLRWQPSALNLDTGNFQNNNLNCNANAAAFVTTGDYSIADVQANAFRSCDPPCVTVSAVSPSTIRYGEVVTITGATFYAGATITCVFTGVSVPAVELTSPATRVSDSTATCTLPEGIYGTVAVTATLVYQSVPYLSCAVTPPTFTAVGAFNYIVFTGPQLTGAVPGTAASPLVKDCLALTEADDTAAGYTATTSSGTYCCAKIGLSDGTECVRTVCAGALSSGDCILLGGAFEPCLSDCYAVYPTVNEQMTITTSQNKYISDNQAPFAGGAGTASALSGARDCWIRTDTGVLTTGSAVISGSDDYCCTTQGWFAAGACNFGCPLSPSSEAGTYFVDTSLIGYQGNPVCYVNCFAVTESP